MRKDFFKLFPNRKPLLGMVHLKGINDDDILNRAKTEIDMYYRLGIDGVIVENYFGNYYHMRMALAYLKDHYPNKIYGVNALNFDVLGFELANTYQADFIQLDSVVGHVKPRDEASMEAFLKLYRSQTDALVFGGVRFKYQPVLSDKSLSEDLAIAIHRCDAIVVTGEGTGLETDLAKIKTFRSEIKDFPLLVGAGLNCQNAKEQMQFADGAIVGSYFKENHQDTGELNPNYVEEMISLFRKIREEKYD